MVLKNSQQNVKPCFSKSMTIKLQSEQIQELIEKISNYAFVVTTICMVLVYAILGQIRRVTENEYIAKSFSLATLCFSIIWNFSYFLIHFDAALNREVSNIVLNKLIEFPLPIIAIILVLHDMLLV